jgi:hypothetical protein
MPIPKGDDPVCMFAGPEGGFKALVWLAIILGSLLLGNGTIRVSWGDTGTRNKAGHT